MLSRIIINIYNDIARKYGNVTVEYFQKYEKIEYMTFTINNLVFMNSMQFMKSSLDALVEDLTNNDFKYLSDEFSTDLLEFMLWHMGHAIAGAGLCTCLKH